MKAVKIIGIVLGSLVALVGGFFAWFYVTKVMAPEPVALCEHTVALMKEDLAGALKAETGGGKLAEELAQKQIEEFSLDCVKRAERHRAFDAVGYAEESKCTMATNTFDDLGKCSKKLSMR
jgi:hypothetical protein